MEVMDMQMQGLDTTNYLIDTIKYTELYPRDDRDIEHERERDRDHESSGFSSSNSSTTESALRKNLLEFERQHSEQIENHIEDDIDEVDEFVENFDPPPVNSVAERSFQNVDSRLPPPDVEIESDVSDGPPDRRGPEPVAYISDEYDTGNGESEPEPEPEPETKEFRQPDPMVAVLQKDPPIFETTKCEPKTKPQNFEPPQLLPESDSKNNKFDDDIYFGNVYAAKTYTKDSDKYFKNEVLGNVILSKNTFTNPYSEQTQQTYQNFEKTQSLPVKTFKKPEPPKPDPPYEKIVSTQFKSQSQMQTQRRESTPAFMAPTNVSIYNEIPPNIPNPKQVVRYPSILPTWSPPPIRKRIPPIPGILGRYNMDQWVAKIIWLYTNGDERNRRVEYRFRPDKDVRSFDGLCDILSKRLGLTRGVRYIYSLSGRPILNLDDLRHEHSYVVSSTKKFKALNYGGDSGPNYPQKISPMPPPTTRMNLPPVIRVKKEPGLRLGRSNSNSRSRSPKPKDKIQPQQQQQNYLSVNPAEDMAMGMIKRNSPASEAEKLVNAVIGETNPVQRKVVRIINGENPSIQSQVLLNTRVSQEWEDLVRDLSLAVKFPKTVKCHLETLVGRKILSYSQLRTELNAGNQTFYIYGNEERSLSKNSNTMESLRNMKNLTIQDARKAINTNLPHPPVAPVIKKAKSLIPLRNNNNNNVRFEMSRSGSKIETTRNRFED